MLLESVKKPLIRKNSNGKKEECGSITKEFVRVNGAKQGMIIETTNEEHPVLLFLHGFGFPAYPIIKANDVQLENYFTVCYWEQRGAGISYQAENSKELIKIEDAVDDVIEVANYLRGKYAQSKIYLLGHSWGTYIGSLVAKKAPELFHAYIGVGQIGSAKESEKEAYDFILQTATARQDKKALKEINKFPFNDLYYENRKYGSVRMKYLEKFGGGTTRKGYSNFQLLQAIMSCPMYSFTEKGNFFRGLEYTSRSFLSVMATTDLVELVPNIDIRVFIMHGKNDYTTSYNQAKRFYNALNCPSKKMFTFQNSAHTPYIEEKEKFYKLIKNEILKETTNL